MKKPTPYTPLSKSILRTLLYFDIFKYPLTAEEVFYRLQTNHVTADDVKEELKRMSKQSQVYSFDKFYSIQNNSSLESRRKQGNLLAQKYLKLAESKARLIASFPFVRAVMASGSLSKEYMDEKSDLDFFIITKPKRLWIARTLLVIYKRLFLSGSHKFFCVNYFVDEDHLEIEEKNLFTATELATLMPLYGKEYYSRLIEANRWVKNFLPNFKPRCTEQIPTCEISSTKKFLESLLNFFGGGLLEKVFMNLTGSRWKKIYRSKYEKKDFDIAFKTKSHASKNHPNFFQKKITELYQERLTAFENQSGISWYE
jgi:uncharacterized protein YktA (UPF0223 family)